MAFSEYMNFTAMILKLKKVHIFWDGHIILQNLHQLFDWQYIGQTIGGDFAKFCGLLRIYKLYLESCQVAIGQFFVIKPDLISNARFLEIKELFKVYIFWEGHKILRNLHLTVDWHYIGQQ